jgi:putative FmdB family regulatory protein
MPTYVYECGRCGHRFELLQGINDPPRQRCPECRGKVKRVLLPGGGLIFKGSGFYITDYKRKEESASEVAKRSAGEKPGGAPKEKEKKKEREETGAPGPGPTSTESGKPAAKAGGKSAGRPPATGNGT